MPSLLRWFGPFFVAAVGLPAQTIHLVGPGGLPQIRDALAIAQPGDRIHVQPGSYAHFTATVGVTIRALVPGTVEVGVGAAFVPPGCTIFCSTTEGATKIEPPAGQTTHVVGVQFLPLDLPVVPFGAIRHRVEVSGQVHFEGCTLQSTSAAALTVATGSRVHLRDCSVLAQSGPGGHGMNVGAASVTAVGCGFAGGFGGGVLVGHGIVASNAVLQLSDCVLAGGSGILPSQRGEGLSGTGTAWLHGCALSGGCAVQWAAGTARFDACTFTDAFPGCSTPANGPFLLGVAQPAPPLLGAPFALQWQTEPNGLVAVFASFGLGRLDLPGILEQPGWVDPTSEFFLGALFADASGAATTTLPLPANPALTDLELWLKGVSGFAFPLQSSVPVGGVLR